MSEQTKSDFKMAGAGFMGFVAVVGGAGLLLTQLSGRRAAPQTALSPLPASLPVASSRPVSETRLASPAPIIGSVADDVVDETVASAAVAGPAGGAAVEAAAAGSALEAMAAPRFSGKGESVSTASAEVRRFAGKEESAAPAAASKPVPRIRLDKTAARGSIASTVHYGVTSRAELMGRAAGPVYNFTGRSVAGGSRLNEQVDASARLEDVLKKIDASDLSSAQKSEMKARLANMRAGAAK